jgi:uncharacterized protein (TIGR03000 family)
MLAPSENIAPSFILGKETPMRRMFVGTTFALLMLAVPSVVQAQHGHVNSGQGSSSRGGFGFNGSSHGGSRNNSFTGFGRQSSGTFGSFGRTRVSGPGYWNGGGNNDLLSQDFSQGIFPQNSSSMSAGSGSASSSYSPLGMGYHSSHHLATSDSIPNLASGSAITSSTSLGMGYQGPRSMGANSANMNTRLGSASTSSTPLGMGSQNLNPRGTTTPTTTPPASSNPPPPLQVVANPGQTQLGNKGEIEVVVPNANATVSIDGSPVSTSGGTTRYLQTPDLTLGTTYSYTVTVTWQDAGRTMTRTQQVQVTAGALSVANFMQAVNLSN